MGNTTAAERNWNDFGLSVLCASGRTEKQHSKRREAQQHMQRESQKSKHATAMLSRTEDERQCAQARPPLALQSPVKQLGFLAKLRSMNVLKWRQQQCWCGKLGMQDAVGDNWDIDRKNTRYSQYFESSKKPARILHCNENEQSELRHRCFGL